MASSGAVRAGKAFIELAANNTLLKQGLARAKQMVNAFAKGVIAVNAAINIGKTVGQPLEKAFKDFVGRGTQLAKLSEALGVPVEKLSLLQYAFEKAGVDSEDFAESVKGLSETITHAADGDDEVFRKLRLNARALRAMPVDEQLDAVANALSKVKDSTDQMDVAKSLGLEKLLPLLKKGAAGIAEFKAEGAKVGAGMTTGEAQQSLELSKAWSDILLQLKYALQEVGRSLLPEATGIKGFADDVKGAIAGAREWIRNNKAIIIVAASVAAGLIVAAGAIVGLSTAAGIAGTAISAVIAVLGLLKASLLLLVSPIGLVVGAIGGLGYLFATQTEAGQRMTSNIGGYFKDMANTAKEAWGGIAAAMQKGDWSLAIKIAIAGLNVEWRKLVVNLTEGWNWFKKTFVDGWSDMVAGMKMIFIDFAAFISRTFGMVVEKIVKATAWAAEKVGMLETAKSLREDYDFSDENINRNRDAMKKGILDARRDQQKRRDEARAADLREANNDLANARKAFQESLEQSREGKTDEPKEGGYEHKGAGKGGDFGANIPKLYNAVKGAFGGPLGQQLGYGDKTSNRDIMQDGVKEQKKGNELLKAILQKVNVPKFT